MKSKAVSIFYKLLFGEPHYNKRIKNSAYKTYILNCQSIWHNKQHLDTGFEKLLRLILVSTQILFPGIHLMQLIGKRGIITRNFVKECYVILKTLLPLYFLTSGLYTHLWAMYVATYLLIETVCYVACIIFVSDIFVEPRSHRRNLLLLLFNYLEICFCYAVIYGTQHLLKGDITGYVDYLYFSVVTSTTIGYGDIAPASNFAKMVVSSQAILSLAFVGIFLNYFGSKMERIYKSDDN